MGLKKLVHAFILVISLFLLSSCASVLNRKTMSVIIHTAQPSKIVYQDDTFETKHNKVVLKAERKKENLNLTAISSNGKTSSISVKPVNSVAYYLNIFNYGIGMLIDRKQPRRYGYPIIYLSPDGVPGQYRTYGPYHRKGDYSLHLSLPHINVFRISPPGEGVQSSFGFWGAMIGVDYYRTSLSFINISASVHSDFFIPVPAPVDLRGEFRLITSKDILLSNNHEIGRIVLGYGISFSENKWKLSNLNRFNSQPPTPDPVSKSTLSAGLVFNFYYPVWQVLNIGLIYRPGFYRFNAADHFEYEHMISIDFAIRIPLTNN